MRTTKVPGGIIIIFFMGLLLSCFLVYTGFAAAVKGAMLAEINATEGIGSIFGKMYRAFGVFFMIMGVLFTIISMGLLMMKEWARHHGSWMSWVICSLSFIMAMILGYFDIINSIPYFVVAIIFGGFALYLKKPATKLAYDVYGTEAPTLRSARRASHHEVREAANVIVKVPVPEGSRPGVRVPNTMRLCPNCDTMNPREKESCRICGMFFEE